MPRQLTDWRFTGGILLLCLLFARQAPWSIASDARNEASAAGTRPSPQDYRSRNFLVHTDLKQEDAQALLEKLETMLRIISRYWGAPMRKTIECYVVDDLENWSSAELPAQARGIVRSGGVTMAQGTQRGRQLNLNATVYASSKFGTPQHEAVHAYCYQAFGRTGPTWYAEGMAEMGNFWVDGDATVTAPEYVVQFLLASPYKSVAQITDDQWGTGDGWQNYAWRWALCHFLVNNGNYNERFRVLGVGFLAGRQSSFERTYAARMKELEFEFRFFIDHLQRGFNVSRCDWNWSAKYRPQSGSRPVTSEIRANAGWQPSKLRIEQGRTYHFVAEGSWKITADEEFTADGDDAGRGRLTGIVFDDYELSAEFPLGIDGEFTAEQDGQLLLRCQDEWNALEDNSGTLDVELTVVDGT